MMVSAGFKKAMSSSDVVGDTAGSRVVGETGIVSVLSSSFKTVEDNLSVGVDVKLLFVSSSDVLSVVNRNVFTCLLEFMAVLVLVVNSLRASSSFFLCLARPRIFCEIEWILARE